MFLAYLTVLQTYLQLYDLKCQKIHISAISVHKYHKAFFLSLFDRFTLRLITTVWPELWENSYLPHFSALVSQLVFLAYLSVLRFFTTVWPEISKLSYLHHSSAQVSQIVFYLIWPFYDLLQLYDLKCQKTHISTISVHKYHKSCF